MVRIITATKALLLRLTVYNTTQAETHGVVPIDDDTAAHMFNYVAFLARCILRTSILSEKELRACRMLVGILNTGFPSFVHVCRVGCMCGGEPAREMYLAMKVPWRNTLGTTCVVAGGGHEAVPEHNFTPERCF